jgi:hypothetical protein
MSRPAICSPHSGWVGVTSAPDLSSPRPWPWTRSIIGHGISQGGPRSPTRRRCSMSRWSTRLPGWTLTRLRVLDDAERAAAHTAPGQVQVAPLIGYHRASILRRGGHDRRADAAMRAAREADHRWSQASRLDDVAALEPRSRRTGMTRSPRSSLATGTTTGSGGRCSGCMDSGRRQ